MGRELPFKWKVKTVSVAVVLIFGAVFFVVLTLFLDILRSKLQHTGYYFSESFLFSSFWWLFPLILFGQVYFIKKYSINTLLFYPLFILLPVLIHLIAFPLLVWILSGIFYDHIFSVAQTFRFTLSDHFFELLILYALPVIFRKSILQKVYPSKREFTAQPLKKSQEFVTSFLVNTGNATSKIDVAAIHFISANPPYVNIHTEMKKYLHTATLKSFIELLDPSNFIRIHKSTIVQIRFVESYTSRHNGDYELTLQNNETLRLSRNYAKHFLESFNSTHRVELK